MGMVFRMLIRSQMENWEEEVKTANGRMVICFSLASMTIVRIVWSGKYQVFSHSDQVTWNMSLLMTIFHA